MKVSVKFDGSETERSPLPFLRDGSVWVFENVQDFCFSVQYNGKRAWLEKSSGGRTCYASSRLRKKSVPVEIGGIFGDTKPSPATFLALLGQLCAICFSRFLAQTTFSATC